MNKKTKLIQALNLLGEDVLIEIINNDGTITIPIFKNDNPDKIDKRILHKYVTEINPTELNKAIIVMA